MYIIFKNSRIFYEVVGNGEKITTFLCGWGYDSSLLKPLGRYLTEEKQVYIDFPNTGKSEDVKCDWNVQDYAELVLEILNKENISSTKIIAHSFGGKVAILLASKYNIVESLVLLASAGIKPKFSLKTKIKILRFKYAKKHNKSIQKFGSEDYKNLPINARKTFVQIVNFHIDFLCEKIRCRTLIIAGKKDKDTPLYMQKKLHKNIKNSRLVVFNAGHYVWTENIKKVMNEINKFLTEEI